MKQTLAILLWICFFTAGVDGKDLPLDEASLDAAPFQLEAKSALHPSGDFTLYELRILIKKEDEYKYHLDLFQFDKESKHQHSAAVWYETTDETGQRSINVKFNIGKINTETVQVIIWRDHPRRCFDCSTYRLNLDSPLIVNRKWN